MMKLHPHLDIYNIEELRVCVHDTVNTLQAMLNIEGYSAVKTTGNRVY